MPKKWENYWPSVQTDDERNARNRRLLTLGNLTIITASLNSSIRDGAWDVKRNGKGNNKGLNHYAAGLDTFSQYLTKSVWDEASISDRCTFLSQKAVFIWCA